MNILYLYNETQTYTATVFEHIGSLARYSKFSSFFCHIHQFTDFDIDLSRFDAVAIHYTIRLPFDQISDSVADALKNYRGLKFLFIQDEYDHTHRAWYWIKHLGIQLVFTVVPQNTIQKIYPAEEFPGVRFVSILTGYVPEELKIEGSIVPASMREVIVGYRGRPLPLRYGKLGFEKVAVGKIVSEYCRSHNIRSDIAWTEEARIYGSKWYDFLRSCRSMLGSESGSNVFDWDGSLKEKVEYYRSKNKIATEEEIYKALVEPLELEGAMNQVSPRIFEAIASGAALVLFEGDYSGVVKPGEHFIPLKKDGSNLDEVFRRLNDSATLDAMTARAYQHVIVSGKYSYEVFAGGVDQEVHNALRAIDASNSKITMASSTSAGGIEAKRSRVSGIAPISLTTHPVRSAFATYPISINIKLLLRSATHFVLIFFWSLLPLSVRNLVRPKIAQIRKLVQPNT